MRIVGYVVHQFGSQRIGQDVASDLDQRLVGRVKTLSARAIHHERGGSGVLWQRDFDDHAVRNDEALVEIARYIVANPLRANLVDNVADYPHWYARRL